MAKEKTAEEIALDNVQAANAQAEATQETKVQQDQQLAAATEAQQIDSIVPKTETAAKIDAGVEAALENAAKANTVTDLGTLATATQWRVDEHGRQNHPNDVKFQVSYGKGFKGDKTMVQGSIHVVSQETADLLIAQGIGNIVL